MQNATSGGASLRSDDRNDDDRSIASHLVTLIGQVQANIGLIESAIAREPFPGNQEIAANVIVLDDVTPRYAKAHAALSACSANLGRLYIFYWIPGPQNMEPVRLSKAPGRWFVRPVASEARRITTPRHLPLFYSFGTGPAGWIQASMRPS